MLDNFNPHEYLRILGLSADRIKDDKDIRARWLELCKIHHPDKGGDPEKFEEITHAYKMLTDMAYRHKNKDKSMSKNPGNLDLRIQIPLPFEDCCFGRTLTLSFNVLEFKEDHTPILKKELQVESITLVVEPCSFSGIQKEFIGKGHRCGETRGKIILMASPGTHPRFKAQTADIFTSKWDVASEEEIDLDVLLTGGKVQILTVHGFMALKVKPGTRPGSTLKIIGGGLRGGAHIVKVLAKFPTEVDLKKPKTIWEKLSINWEEK